MLRNKRKKFIELAEKRVNKALKQLQLIGNLSNKRNYDYDQSDYKKIFRAIDEEVKSMKQKFIDADKDDKSKFKLRNFDHQTKAQALVRESIQNSLDAGISEDKAVEIKFSFHKLSKDILKKYFKGKNHDIEKHLNSCGISIPSKSLRCLVIEDFNTEGLTGSIDNL